MFKIINVNQERINKFIDFVGSVEISNHSKVVEVGCGDGMLSYLMCKKYPCSMELIDIVDQRNNQYTAGKVFHKIDCSVDPLPYQDSSVDILIATQVIEHLENPTYFFNQVYRILKPGGFVIVSYPNFVNVFNRISFMVKGNVKRLGGTLNSGGHINLFGSGISAWLSPYFEPYHIEGDFLAIVGKIRGVIRKVFPIMGDRHILIPKIKGVLFSYNINACYVKLKYQEEKV